MAVAVASATSEEPSPEEEAPRASVTPAEVGRAIILLQQQRNHRRTPMTHRVSRGELDRWGRWQRKGQTGWFRRHYHNRVFTDAQIALMFDITLAELKRLAEVWRESKAKPVSEKKLDSMIFQFLRKNKRWPKVKEFRLKMENGLPSERQLNNHGGYDQAQVRVAERYKLKPAELLSIPNLTTRRDAITASGGMQNVIRGGEQIQSDDYGTLWRLPGETARVPMVIVEVVNSTENPDGSFDHYFLRVPPAMTTAREAVAWTFELTPEELVFEAQS